MTDTHLHGRSAVDAGLAAIGRAISPQAARATMALLAPSFAQDFGRAVAERTDLAYGDDPAQRLDVFEPADTVRGLRPALVFVHGGGYVGGDKHELAPFYRNVGVWAVQRGMVGINLNHRLAPAHRWPAAADDVAAALAWIARHATDLGIDARRIVLMGHSAGATHVASCIDAAHRAGSPQPAAALVLVSGSYALGDIAPTPNRVAYFGADHAAMAARSSIDAVAGCGLPTLVAVAEDDPDENLAQGRQLADRIAASGGASPLLVTAARDNHFSTVLRLGAFESTFALALGRFVDAGMG